MIWSSTRSIVLTGLALLVIGVLLPFLMVMGILESTFLLALISYTASVAGLIIGVVGTAMYVRERRR